MKNTPAPGVAFDGRIDSHPLHKSIYDLCQEIEKLPASEQATICVSAASALHDKIAGVLTPFRNLLLVSENADETGYVEGEGWLPLEDIQAAARVALCQEQKTPVVYKTLEEAQNSIPACERPCNVCAPAGHHWYLDSEKMGREAEAGIESDSVPCICKHGDAKVRVSADADDLPEI